MWIMIIFLLLGLVNCDYMIGQISHQVDVEQGSLKITVPIDLPKGVNGLEPNLALIYDSENVFESFLGLGWSIGGLTGINLCMPPFYNNENGKYTYGVDALCLEGKYLIESNGQFKTEIDDYSKITSRKNNYNRIDNFTISTKSSKIMVFGDSPDAKVLLGGSNDVYQWLINEIRDYFGNTIRIEYEKMNGFPYLSSIHYANVKIKFNYIARQTPPLVNNYKDYELYTIKSTLDNIQILVNDASSLRQHSKYSLEYELFKSKMRVKRINYCGSSSNACMKPLTLNYTNDAEPNLAFNAPQNWNSYCLPFDTAFSRSVVDMNGDGLLDLAGIVDQNLVVSLNNGRDRFGAAKNWSKINFGTLDFSKDIARIVDLDRDGLTDLFVIGNDGVFLASNLGVDGQLGQFKKWSSDFGLNDKWVSKTNKIYYLVDVNGDNLPDMVAFLNGGVFVGLNSKQNSFLPKQQWSKVDFTNTYASLFDMNQDGLVDVVGLYGNTLNIQYNTGSSFSDPIKIQLPNSRGLRIADLNNDGRLDIVRLSRASSYIETFVYYNIGLKQFSNPTFHSRISDSNLESSEDSFYLLDVNRDDYLDLVWLNFNSKTIFAALNNQSGFETSVQKLVEFPREMAIKKENLDFSRLFSNETLSFLTFSTCNTFVTHSLSHKPHISSIESSSGTAIRIHYGDLSDPGIYTSNQISSFPYFSKYFEKSVVKSIEVPTGLEESGATSSHNTTYFKYENIVYNLLRPGLFSFQALNQSFSTSGLLVRHQYFTNYPLIGKQKSSTTYLHENKIDESRITYTIRQDEGLFKSVVYVIEPGSSEQSMYDVSGRLIKRISSSFVDMDNYGNIGKVNERFTDADHDFSRISVNEYEINVDDWFVGSIKSTQVLYGDSTRKADPRLVLYDFNKNTRVLNSMIMQPTDKKYARIELYQYDRFGNMILKLDRPYESSQLMEENNLARNETFEFDELGLRLLKHCNSLGHCESFKYDVWGNMIMKTGANGLVTRYTYDEFGRKINEIKPDINVTWKYTSNVDGAKNGYYRETVLYNDRPKSYKIYDKLGRVVQTGKAGFKGDNSIVDYEYDMCGRLIRESLPRFQSASTVWYKSYSYDELGRKIEEIIPLDNSEWIKIAIKYVGLETVMLRNGQEQKRIRYNAFGNIVAVTDGIGSVTKYFYDAYGSLEKVVDPLGHETKIVYNSVGSKVEMLDPSLGIMKFDYNVFNELVYQKDAKNQETFLKRDRLGRIVERKEVDTRTQWVYDTAAYGIGRLAETRVNNDYLRSHEYDHLGREIRTKYVIENEELTVENEFDEYNRIVAQTYPGDFKYYWCYDYYDYLIGISKTDRDCKTSPLWTGLQYNARDKLVREVFDNRIETSYEYDAVDRLQAEFSMHNSRMVRKHAYTFDNVNNLRARETSFAFSFPQASFHKNEAFNYDALDRLTRVSYQDNRNQAFTYYLSYDQVGNVISNSHLDKNDFIYDKNKPFALTKAGTNTYSYDANGNTIVRNGKRIVWSSFNSPIEIETSKGRIYYKYGPNREKFKRVDSNGDETIYLGDFYERIKRKSSSKTSKDLIVHKYTVNLNGRMLFQTFQNSDGTDQETIYFNSDFTGTIDTASLVDGRVLYHFNYSAFGEQNIMLVDNSKDYLLCLLNRGFGGHEYIDDTGLIHMNGRIYDPIVGRFLSPDPFVDDIYETQALNRYAYARNNPFKYRDPSGHFIHLIFSIISSFVFASTMTAVTTTLGLIGVQVLGMGPLAAKLFSHAIVGGLSGLIASHGRLNDGIRGLIFGAVMGGIGFKFGKQYSISRVLVESVAGGVVSKIQGGSFGEGFGKALLVSASRFLYNKFGGDRLGLPGKEPSEPRKGANELPRYGENNIGIQDDPKSIWYEGRLISRILNMIPGINDVAFIHDNIQVRLDEIFFKGARSILNVPMMLPAFALTFGAASSGAHTYAMLKPDKDKAKEKDTDLEKICSFQVVSSTSSVRASLTTAVIGKTSTFNQVSNNPTRSNKALRKGTTLTSNIVTSSLITVPLLQSVFWLN